MGNKASSEHALRARLHREKQNNITWNEFVFAIREMNALCRAVMEQNGDYLCFALTKNSRDSFLWKQSVRILCFKVNFHTKQIISCKSLSFEEFMNAHSVKKSGAIHTPPNDSMITSTCTEILAETADQDGTCVICMDSRNQVLLPCLHAFCLLCVSQQMEYRTPFCCPICRTPIQKPIEESWEVPDIPQPQEVAAYLSEIAGTTRPS